MLTKTKSYIRNLFRPDETEQESQEQKMAVLLDKANAVFGRNFNNTNNPFLKENGELFNPFLDYQTLLDNPNISQKAKNYIKQATGLTPTMSTVTTTETNTVTPTITTGQNGYTVTPTVTATQTTSKQTTQNSTQENLYVLPNAGDTPKSSQQTSSTTGDTPKTQKSSQQTQSSYADSVGKRITDTSKYSNSAAKGQCVWYVRGRAAEKLGVDPGALGNAKDVWYNAPSDKKVSATIDNLKPNMIVSYASGPGSAAKYGHVIYIEDVVGDTVYYTEGGSTYYNNGTDGVVKTASRQGILDGVNSSGSKIGASIVGFIDLNRY